MATKRRKLSPPGGGLPSPPPPDMPMVAREYSLPTRSPFAGDQFSYRSRRGFRQSKCAIKLDKFGGCHPGQSGATAEAKAGATLSARGFVNGVGSPRVAFPTNQKDKQGNRHRRVGSRPLTGIEYRILQTTNVTLRPAIVSDRGRVLVSKMFPELLTVALPGPRARRTLGWRIGGHMSRAGASARGFRENEIEF